jgi:Putative outer membrane beta-barrel porin, MtrB/PioB
MHLLARLSTNEDEARPMIWNNAKRLGGIVSVLLFISSLAWADSGVGVDTWRGNVLDPTGGQASQQCDEDGTSWLSPLEHRSPTGNLYDCPSEPPLVRALSDWVHYGVLEFGYVNTGDDRFALYNRYADWKANQGVGLLDLHFERPSDGTYAEVRGSRVDDDDQYYQAVYGQAGAFKVQAFIRDMPNILSTDAKPIWNGVGSNVLTLPHSLTPGESSSAQVAAVSAATPVQTLGVTRKKEGLDLSTYFTPHWTAYLDVTHERRGGDRPYGGPFGEDWPGENGGTGAILETVEPIDDMTINLNTGARYAGTLWRADFGYSGSYYRDEYLSYSFQQPFSIPSTAGPGQIAPPLTIGQMSTPPNNNYHNLHATVTRITPMNGEVSFTVSEVLMTQRDTLIPPTNCQGFLGYGTPSPGSTQLGPQNVGPQNPFLIPCSQWNTPAALSQSSADVNMHNTLAAMTLVLRPRSDLDVNGGLKFYRQDYLNDYLSLNPSNGDYGYIGENGAYLHEYGYPLSFLSSTFPVSPPQGTIDDGRVAPYLLSLDETTAYGGVTWKISEHDRLGLVYTHEDYRPTSRERDHVDDDSIKLTWVDKMLPWLTFRANYTFLLQTGSLYSNDVYDYAFLAAVPGFAQAYPTFMAPPDTVSQLRVYDIANYSENKVDLMSTIAPRDDLTISASFRGDWNKYPAQLGRQGYNTRAAQISADWAPTPTDNVSAYIGYDNSTLHQSAVASTESAPCANLGCPFYPTANQWWSTEGERDSSAGLTARHRIDRTTFDVAWSYIYSRGTIDYSAASAGAFEYASEFTPTGNFPAMTYRVNSVTVGATVQLSERASLRLYDKYEVGRIADWQYNGFNQGLVVGNTLYTDGGPQSYSENLVGLLVNVKL